MGRQSNIYLYHLDRGQCGHMLTHWSRTNASIPHCAPVECRTLLYTISRFLFLHFLLEFMLISGMSLSHLLLLPPQSQGDRCELLDLTSMIRCSFAICGLDVCHQQLLQSLFSLNIAMGHSSAHEPDIPHHILKVYRTHDIPRGPSSLARLFDRLFTCSPTVWPFLSVGEYT